MGRNLDLKVFWEKKDDFLIKNYGKMYVEDICKALNKTESVVLKRAKKLGLKSTLLGISKRKIKKKTFYTLNERFFESPALLNSYWAGFIAADGCITAPYGNRKKMLTIDLAVKDKEQLEKFKNDIRYTGPLQFHKKAVKICIRNNKICRDLLKNYRITSRKSLTLEFPENLSKDQSLSFIVGYIDGDGHISHQKKQSRTTISIIGTYAFLKEINKILNRDGKLVCLGKVYVITLSNKTDRLLERLNDFRKRKKLPVLNRKWEVLDGVY